MRRERTDINDFIVKNPPRYGLSKRENGSIQKLILIFLGGMSLFFLVFYLTLMKKLNLMVSLILISFFIVFFYYKMYLLLTEALKYAQKNYLSFAIKFIRTFETQTWAFYNTILTKYVITAKEDEIIVLIPSHLGKMRAIFVKEWTEHMSVSLIDKIKLVLGKVTKDRIFLDRLKKRDYSFRISIIGSALLPHPSSSNILIKCKNCIEIAWFSWMNSAIAMNPDLLKDIYTQLKFKFQDNVYRKI